MLSCGVDARILCAGLLQTHSKESTNQLHTLVGVHSLRVIYGCFHLCVLYGRVSHGGSCDDCGTHNHIDGLCYVYENRLHSVWWSAMCDRIFSDVTNVCVNICALPFMVAPCVVVCVDSDVWILLVV